MKNQSSRMQSLWVGLPWFLLLTANAFSQLSVTDAVTQANIANQTQQQSQQYQGILQQWTTSFQKLDQQIKQLNSLVNVAGNPQAALGAIGGTGNLNNIGSTLSQVGQLGNQLMQTADGARSLGYKAQGAFQTIPTSLPNGFPIQRNTTAYNKFDAYEQNFTQLNSTLQQCQSTRQSLLSELQSVLAVTPQDASQQQAQLTKIAGINAELTANEQFMKQVQTQTSAQAEANIQDMDKQRQALGEQIYAADQQISAQATVNRTQMDSSR